MAQRSTQIRLWAESTNTLTCKWTTCIGAKGPLSSHLQKEIVLTVIDCAQPKVYIHILTLKKKIIAVTKS